MTTTIDNVIAVAASQIGYYERPGGARSKFEAWYPLSGQWCAMGLSWAFAQVGALDIFPKHAYTPSGVQWFKNQSRWYNGISNIQRGDAVYFDFPGLPNRVSHVGLVESVNSDGSVNTIEFNTSAVVGGDQRNGGCVARKRRKAYIVGFGRPNYSKSVPTLVIVVPKPTTIQEEDMLPLILWCYAELVGRTAPPSTDEVANWISGTPGWTSAHLLASFLGAKAERGSVIKAYRDILGRPPESQAVIDSRLTGKPTITQVRISIAASGEALAR